MNPVSSIGTFYKLVENGDDATVVDGNVPFLTQAFFTCGSNEACTKVAKTKGSNDFKEVIGQQKVKEDAVVYEKVNIPKTQGMYLEVIPSF